MSSEIPKSVPKPRLATLAEVSQSVSNSSSLTSQGTDAASQAKDINQHLAAGATCLRDADHKAAMNAFMAALELDPKHVGALTGLSAALNQQGKIVEAIATIRAAIEVAPQNAGLHVQLGHLLNKQADSEAAAVAFQNALVLEPKHVGALSGLSVTLNQQGKTGEAIATLRAAIEVAPQNAGLHIQLGHMLNKKTDYEAAAAVFQAAVVLEPKHVGALTGLSAALNQQGKTEEAIATLRAAIEVAPQNARHHVQLGRLLEERHQLADAAASFRSALEIDISNLPALEGLRRVRNPVKIFELFNRLLECPNDIDLLDQLGGELEVSRDSLAVLIHFALDPRELDIASIAQTPLEHEMLLAIVRATQRQLFLNNHGKIAPLNRLQLAPPTTDVLAEQKSHEHWIPAQWLSSFVLRKARAPHRTAVVVAMRDEGLYLLEWVAHYRVLGFDTIIVYSNDNIDESEDLLRELANHGVITYVENQMDPSLHHHPQRKAYAHALHLLPELWEHDWVLFADADEFLIPDQKYGFRIDALIDDALKCFPARAPSAICFNWFWCVSGDKYSYEPGLLLRRFPHGEGKRGMKSLVRIRDIFSMFRLHFPDYDAEGFLLKSDFTRLSKDQCWKKTPHIFVSGRLNHYWNKSFEEFSVKKARGDAASDRDILWKRGFESFFTTNAEETADNYAPPPEALVVAVEVEMARLRALPEINSHMKKISARLPELLQRFDHKGGLRAIYKNIQLRDR